MIRVLLDFYSHDWDGLSDEDRHELMKKHYENYVLPQIEENESRLYRLMAQQESRSQFVYSVLFGVLGGLMIANLNENSIQHVPVYGLVLPIVFYGGLFYLQRRFNKKWEDEIKKVKLWF